MSNSTLPQTTKSGNPVLSLADLHAFDPCAKERSGESDFCCPLCGNGKPVDHAHRSLGVNLGDGPKKGAWECHRCGQSGKLSDFWTERPAFSPAARKPTPARKPLRMPAFAARDDAPPPDPPPSIADRFPALAGTLGEDYLAGRGLALALCEAAGVRYAPDFHGRPAVVFPILNAAIHEIAAQGRYLISLPGRPNFFTEGSKKDGVFVSPGAWHADDITIVESPIDALSLCPPGYPALALLGKSWPEWLPAFIASTRKTTNIGFDADEPGSQAAHDVEAAAESLAKALRYYDAHSRRLRPSRAKDWNGQLLEVAECRRLEERLFKQIVFLETGKQHPELSRVELLRRAAETLDAFTAACMAADGPEANGFNDEPLNPSSVDFLPKWREKLNRLRP